MAVTVVIVVSSLAAAITTGRGWTGVVNGVFVVVAVVVVTVLAVVVGTEADTGTGAVLAK